MDNQKKMELLADLLEVEVDSLSPEMLLDEIEDWDSMTKLSLIVLMDEECGKKLKPEDIKRFKTVNDIMEFMN